VLRVDLAVRHRGRTFPEVHHPSYLYWSTREIDEALCVAISRDKAFEPAFAGKTVEKLQSSWRYVRQNAKGASADSPFLTAENYLSQHQSVGLHADTFNYKEVVFLFLFFLFISASLAEEPDQEQERLRLKRQGEKFMERAAATVPRVFFFFFF
jgi:hypothetical protein